MIRPFRLLPFAVALAVQAAAEPAPSAPDAFPLETYHAVGGFFATSNRLTEMGWTEAQITAFVDGLSAALHGQAAPLDHRGQALNQAILQRLEELESGEAQAMAQYFKTPANREKFMKEACKQFQLVRADSGLAFRLLTQGGSVRPQPEDRVVLTYSVTTPDGRVELKQLAVRDRTMAVADLLPGLAETVQMISVGDAAMVVLPPELSYGDGAWPAGVERDLPLLYLVELKQILPAAHDPVAQRPDR